jgi:hypothetical protein
MRGTQIGGIAIQILDASGDLISKHAKEGRTMSLIFLNSAEHAVAARMGLREDEVIAIKAHGRGGLSGIALLSLHGVKSPFAPAKPLPGDTGDAGSEDEDDIDEDGRLAKNLDFALERARKKKAAKKAADDGPGVIFPRRTDS